MKFSPLANLGQCPHENRYPLRCSHYDGSKPERCERCFVFTDPDDDGPLRIIEEQKKAMEHLPDSSKESFRFYMRDLKK